MPVTAQNSETGNARRSRRPDSQKPLVSQRCKYRGQIHTKASLRGTSTPSSSFSQPQEVTKWLILLYLPWFKVVQVWPAEGVQAFLYI